jgi:glycosyltransferase involved in cell wall biosynthesis
MRIVLDFNPALRARYSGFNTYGVGLVSGLLSLPEVQSLVLLLNRPLVPLARELGYLDEPRITLVSGAMRWRRMERWWRLVPWPTLERLAGSFDVYHSIHHLMPPTAAGPRVLTVHDLRGHRLREIYSQTRRAALERAVKAADRCLAISQATKADMVELLGTPPEKVDVAPLGVTADFGPATPAGRAATLQWLSGLAGRPVKRYAIILGSPDKRKNLPAAIRAMQSAGGRLGGGFALLVCGHTPPDEDLAAMASAAGVAECVVISGPLRAQQLADALAAADMMLFLSLYEGFGLPVLQAMASGVPVISSNKSCMPEVVADAGMLVDPHDDQAIAEAMLKLAGDAALADRYRQAGLARARQYTWRRTAELTLECYRRAMAARGGAH